MEWVILTLIVILFITYLIFVLNMKNDALILRDRFSLILQLDDAKKAIVFPGRIGIEKFRDEIIEINRGINNYKNSATRLIIQDLFHIVLSLIREEHIARIQPEKFKMDLVFEIDGLINEIKNNSILDIYKRFSNLFYSDLFLDTEKPIQINTITTNINDINFTKYLISGIDSLLQGMNFQFTQSLASYKIKNDNQKFYNISQSFIFLYFWILRNLRSVHSEDFYTENFRKNNVTTSFWAADDELLAFDIAKATLGILENDSIFLIKAFQEYYNRPKMQKNFLYIKTRNYEKRIQKIINSIENQ